MKNLSTSVYNNVLPISAGGTGVTSAAAALTALGAQPLLVSGTSIKTINTTNVLSSGNIQLKILLPTPVQSKSYSATAFQLIRCDSTNGVFNITLPVSPTGGDIISFLDVSGSFGTNAVTVLSNGNTIENDTSLILNIPYAIVSIIYTPAASNWKITDNRITMFA